MDFGRSVQSEPMGSWARSFAPCVQRASPAYARGIFLTGWRLEGEGFSHFMHTHCRDPRKVASVECVHVGFYA